MNIKKLIKILLVTTIMMQSITYHGSTHVHAEEESAVIAENMSESQGTVDTEEVLSNEIESIQEQENELNQCED